MSATSLVWGFGSLACLSLASCAIESSERFGETDRAILGGEAIAASEYPTVVALQIGPSLCTGTLVAPDLVLTAGHCVHPQTLGFASQDELDAHSAVIIDSAVVDGASGSQVIAFAESIPHPSYGDPGDPDVALVRLQRAVTDREPSPINMDPNLGAGMSVDMVGFGLTENGTHGTKYSVTDVPTGVCSTYGQSDSLFLCYSHRNGTGKCNGDSGGPSFATIAGRQTVVGITSYGDIDCEIFSADMRTSATRPFLLQHAPELLCGRDGYCDPSCEGEDRVDTDCRMACSSDDQCGAEQYCEGGEFCAAMPFSPGGLGAACGEGQLACESGICATSGEERRCSQTCTPGAEGVCPGGFDCLDTGNGEGACWPDSQQSVGGGCSASGSAASPWWLLLALVALRRRREVV